MSQVKMEELSKDVEELKSFMSQTERSKVKDLLSISIRKLESELLELKREEEMRIPNSKSDENLKPPRPKTNVCYNTKITNYAWDQSDKFVKLYITLTNVQSLPKENVKCEFTPKSMDLVVNGLDGKNYTLLINNLMHSILSEGSYCKVKTDMVLVMMKKEVVQNWTHITVQDKKAKESKLPKMEEGEDPGKGLMDLMKQMYEDGDDDMKRTIAKAWTESRDKATMGGEGGGGFEM